MEKIEINRNMTSNSKTAATASNGGVKGFAKNLMLRAMSGEQKKQELAEAKKTADRRFTVGISLTLLSAIGGLVYNHYMSAQFAEKEALKLESKDFNCLYFLDDRETTNIYE